MNDKDASTGGGKKNAKAADNKSLRNILLGLAAFTALVVLAVLATPAMDNIIIPGTPAREMPQQRPGIVDIPTVFTTVQDSSGNVRNISTSVALDLDERQVRRYDIDDLRSIVAMAMQQVDGDSLDALYDTSFVSELIREELSEHIDPAHLLGVYITDIGSGTSPIDPGVQRPSERPSAPTWRMR